MSYAREITFEDVEFRIPDDYNQSGDIKDYNELGSEGKSCFYTNGLNETIEITVITDWMGMSLDDMYRDDASDKTINGHEGLTFKENDINYFGYIDGDSGILVGTSNPSCLSKIII